MCARKSSPTRSLGVAELSAAELRRLRSLEQRVVRVEEHRRSLREERDELKAMARQLRRDLRDLQRTLATVQKGAAEAEARIIELVEANRELAAALRAAEKEALAAGEVAERSAARAEAAQAALEKAKADGAAARTEVKHLAKALATAQRQLELSQKQLAAEGGLPLLHPDQVKDMLDDFVESFEVHGLAVRDGSIRLNVAFGAVEGEAGFVIPTPELDTSNVALHQITLNLSARPGVTEVG